MLYAFSIRRSPLLLARACSHALAPPRRLPLPASTNPRIVENRRPFTHSPSMASDEDYAAFLAKANQDTGAAPSTQSIKTKAVDAEVPHVLLQVEEYYISDADEPFEPVSLKWDSDSIPSEGQHAYPQQHFGVDR